MKKRDGPSFSLLAAAQYGHEIDPVLIILKDFLSVDSPEHDMIDIRFA